MKIVFLQRQFFALPGIAYLAGNILHQGHEADVLIENAEKKFSEVTAEINPGVVGMTLTSSDVNWLIQKLF